MLKTGMATIALVMIVGALAGCEATAEDIERWKGTQRGPAKITAVVVDSRYPFELRGQAAVALVEIVRWENLEFAFEELSEQERQGVIHAMVPRLRKMYSTGASESQGDMPSDQQVNAKDAMVELYEMASADDQALMREQLIDWVTSDFNGHYLQGRRNIGVVVRKLGHHGASALAGIINTKNLLVTSRITKLVVDNGNEESKRIASKSLAKLGRELGDRLRVDMFKAMSQVCGEEVREFTLEYAARHKGDVENQQNAIICVFGGGVSGCGDGCAEPEDFDALFEIAEDEQQDERIRAASYDAIREHGTAKNVPRVMKMLDDQDARYRATGVDIAAHLGGAKVIPDVLERLGESRNPWAWQLKSSRTNNQEYGLCNMGLGQLEQAEGAHEVLVANTDHDDAHVRGGVANMLGIIGTADDVSRLEQMTSDRGRLKGWEPDRVGEHAQQAIERIRDSERPSDVSARRGKACGLDVR